MVNDDSPSPRARIDPAPDGRVAFITGGDSGIGLGIARAFTDAGMRVVITYRSPKHLEEALEQLSEAADRVHAIALDVTDRAALERAAEATLARFGRIDVVVANAGIGGGGPLSTTSYEDYDFTMGVNAGGVFNTIRAFLPRLLAQGEGGHLVATASLAGLLGHGSLGAYTASKFAVVGMMEALRAELDGTGIGVTVFCPGVVASRIDDRDRNRPAGAGAGVAPDPELIARIEAALRAHPGPPDAMDPLEAGRRVLDGIRAGALYVLTTPEFEPELRARGEAILASVPRDVDPSPARVAFGRALLGEPCYAAELDRLAAVANP